MSLKERISSPLEAGISVLDAHQLPPRLTAALDHASTRLARKALHITLVVVRRDYQLPHHVLPTALTTPTSPEFCQTPLSAASSSSSTSRLTSTLKQLVRSGSLHDIASSAAAGLGRSSASVRSNVSSPAFAQVPEVSSPRLRWPLTPMTPSSVPPMTPATTSTTTDVMSQELPDGFGLRLVHDGSLTPRVEKSLRLTLSKTAKLFHLGNEWLSPAVSPAACGLTKQLIHKSIAQGDVLFSSEGLTLVALDRLYSLKSALSSYSRSKSALRLEDAVDELRRLVLANNGAKVAKSDLLRSFDGLSISDQALLDLDRMYCRAYGGSSQTGGIAGMPKIMDEPPRALAEPMIRDAEYETDEELEWAREEVMEIGVALTSTTPACDPPVADLPSPKPPLLKLQTSFLVKPKPIRAEPVSAGGARLLSDGAGIRIEIEEEEDGDRTARPAEELPIMFQPWGGSIDQILSAEALSPQRSSMRMGPTTPNGYDDISPITRGEWGFLMVDDKFQGAKTVKVETW
ncbi:hypothetical protein CC79DRAFT_1373766 [Sarocladium strictum]